VKFGVEPQAEKYAADHGQRDRDPADRDCAPELSQLVWFLPRCAGGEGAHAKRRFWGIGRSGGGRAVTMSFDGVPGGDSSTAAPGAIPGAAPMLSFDARGVPAAGGVESLLGAVRSGAVPTIKGSYETITATGVRGTAVITTAMPFGKTAGQLNPSVNPERFNYPVWVFTVEVTLAGEQPFPAVFGHFVRPDKVALLAPDVRLAVAVDPQNKNQDVAIDWGKVIFKGLFMKGIYGREMFETWYKMAAMIESGLDISQVITHRFPIDDFRQGFEIMGSGKSGKVILDWGVK